MEAIAKGMYIRCSARKMRLVADMIRTKKVESAMALLFSLKKTKKTAEYVDKILKSAVANLKDKNAEAQIKTENLVISNITVDAGPHIKRFKPRAQGRAFRINKKLCHLTLSVSD